jgi:hypothetical protein
MPIVVTRAEFGFAMTGGVCRGIVLDTWLCGGMLIPPSYKSLRSNVL